MLTLLCAPHASVTLPAVVRRQWTALVLFVCAARTSQRAEAQTGAYPSYNARALGSLPNPRNSRAAVLCAYTLPRRFSCVAIFRCTLPGFGFAFFSLHRFAVTHSWRVGLDDVRSGVLGVAVRAYHPPSSTVAHAFLFFT